MEFNTHTHTHFAHLRPPLVNAPAVSSMATCFVIVAMSLAAAPAVARISLLPAPDGLALLLMRAPGVPMILVLPPGVSGALLYDLPPCVCEGAWGAPAEAGPQDSLIEYAPFELFLGPPGPVSSA